MNAAFQDLALPSSSSDKKKYVRIFELYPDILINTHVKMNVDADIRLGKPLKFLELKLVR